MLKSMYVEHIVQHVYYYCCQTVGETTLLVHPGATEMVNVVIAPPLGPTEDNYEQFLSINIYDTLGAIAKCDIGTIRVGVQLQEV